MARKVVSIARQNHADGNIADRLRQLLIGQDTAVDAIVPILDMHAAGLNEPGHPIGSFMLTGPTGTGKTHTVESLAEVLHGDIHKVLRIDCGEYQMSHDVAKLIGAPPGYLGHRETHPILSQARVDEVLSKDVPISIVLFDEIEKAHDSFHRIMLGILDKARLQLGDNSTVDFSKSILFFTSNIGSNELRKSQVGFSSRTVESSARMVMERLKRAFPPEFMNRLDEVIPYSPLDELSFRSILARYIGDLQGRIFMSGKRNSIKFSPEARTLIVDRGCSIEYGARELKRVMHRALTRPLAKLMVSLSPSDTINVEVSAGEICFTTGNTALTIPLSQELSEAM